MEKRFSRSRYSAFTIIIAVIAITLFSFSAFAGTRVSEGDKIERFGLKTLSSEPKVPTIHTDHFIGKKAKTPAKVLMLNFFASWCKPCLAEFPFIQNLDKKYKADGLAIMMVNIDTEKEGLAKAVAFVNEKKPEFAVVSDKFNIVTRRYFDKDFSLPATFLITADGKIAKVFAGGSSTALEKLEISVAELLSVAKKPGNVAIHLPKDAEPAKPPKKEEKQPVKEVKPAPVKAAPVVAPESKKQVISKVYQKSGKTVLVNKGKKHGVKKKCGCSYKKKNGKTGTCKIVKVAGSISRIKPDKPLSKGDKVMFSIP